MSDLTRRFLLRTGAALTTLPAAAQTHHHRQSDADAASAPAATSTPQRFLQPHEFSTLQALCEVIIPADEHSEGAHAAGAAEFIDLLASNNQKIAVIFHGGLAWLNARSGTLFGEPFTGVTEAQQIALVKEIADLDHAAPELKHGAVFFDWARRMTMDAFYTSKAGIADLGYEGNKGMTTYQIPREVLEQALRRFSQG
jgi:hypothetical protein